MLRDALTATLTTGQPPQRSLVGAKPRQAPCLHAEQEEMVAPAYAGCFTRASVDDLDLEK